MWLRWQDVSSPEAGADRQVFSSVQPRPTSYARQNRSFHPMYITPRRVALPLGTPNWSGPSNHERKAVALARPCLLRTLVIQSSARPSLCSLVPPTEHPREMLTVSLPYVSWMRFASRRVPGFGAELHPVWASYEATGSDTAGSGFGITGTAADGSSARSATGLDGASTADDDGAHQPASSVRLAAATTNGPNRTCSIHRVSAVARQVVCTRDRVDLATASQRGRRARRPARECESPPGAG